MGPLVKYGVTGVILGLGIMVALISGVPEVLAQQRFDSFIFIQPGSPGEGEEVWRSVMEGLNNAGFTELPFPDPQAREPRVPGQRQTRRELEETRDSAGYDPSQAGPITQTTTNLSDIVTRSVTLEGRDVQTQERSEAYAREVLRQQRLATLIDQLCREAFGSEECEFKEEEFRQDPQRLLNERERAFVQDPVLFNSLPVELGALGALYSGTVERDETAEEILTLPSHGGPALPYAYSPEIAEMRRRLSPFPNVLKKFDQIVDDVASEYLPPVFDYDTWTTQLVDGETGIEFRLDTAFTDPAGIITGYGHALSAVTTLRDDLKTIADAAELRIAAQLQDTIVDGAVPDRVHKTSQGVTPGVGHNIGEVGTLVSAPANVKVGLQRELLPLLAQIEANPQFVDPSQVENPQGVSAVDGRVDENGNPVPLRLGEPLEEFPKADVVEKGLFEQTGVTERLFENLRSHNILQKFLFEIADDI